MASKTNSDYYNAYKDTVARPRKSLLKLKNDV
jgi:hypothetical protein